MKYNKILKSTFLFLLIFSAIKVNAQKIAAGWSHSLYICNNGSTVNAWGADTSGQLGNGIIDLNPHDLPKTVNNITNVKAIRAGYQHCLALRQDSTVWTWGSNTFGQLGNGTNITSTSPVKVVGINNVIAVSGGQAGYHSIALKSDGTVWTWGKNTEGQLGDGTLNNSNTPVQVLGLANVIAIAGGEYHSLALKNDGTVWAWGRNSNGQLGDSTTTNSSVPVQVMYLSGITDIKGGRYFSFALKNDGTVWSWGQNADGQLGDGTTIQRLTPVQVTGLNQVVAIAGSAFHCLALKDDGTIRSWGRGVDGQLGDGLQTASSTPVQVLSIHNAVEIVSGTNYSFALTATDSIYAWGRNIYGQLGNDTSGNYYYSPVPTIGLCPNIDANPTSHSIAAGWSHSLYLCNNGSTINAWGADTCGQLGNGVIDLNPHPTPNQVNGIANVKSIRAGYQHCLALKPDSTVWTWGSNVWGQLGDGTNITNTSPVQVLGLNQVIAISGGQAGFHSLALNADGTVWTWGKNTEGQLGNGTLINSNVPVQVSNLTNIIAIAGGEYHSLALRADGTVWAWGRNSNGQLGDSTTTNSSIPVKVKHLSNITDIKGGRYFSFALKGDSTVWSWGQNADGQLGDGTTTQKLTPVQVVGLNEVTAIAGSAFHALALKSDGSIRAWGRGVDGQLGDGLQTASSIPVQVLGINNAVEIVSGTNYSFALTATDSIYAWGRNIYGQLGNDTSGNYYYSPVPTVGLCVTQTSAANPIMHKITAGWSHSLYICNANSSLNSWGANSFGQLGNNTTNSAATSTPVPVANLTGVKSVDAGYQHTLALMNDSTVYAWGSNVYGQLGIGTNVEDSIPVMVVGLNNIIAVSGGTAAYHSIALKADGTVWTWGRNSEGQLGDGTNNNSNVPLQVSGISNVIAISGGEYHTLAIKDDGTVWAWGKNTNGQLGNGTTVDSNTPVQVTGLNNVVDVAAGRYFSIALKSDNTVWCWGENLYGQLGNGNTVDSSIPVQVSGLTDATAIAGGAFHGIAIKSDSTVVTWGRNTYGNLGNGTTTDSSTPVAVSNLTGIVAIDGGTNYTLAMNANDVLFSFGRNVFGQLGDGTTSTQNTAVNVISLCTVVTEVENNSTNPESQISIFPNPSHDGKFKLKSTILNGQERLFNNNQIKVYSLIGDRVVYDLNNNIIDIANQPNGIYFISILEDGKSINFKIVKQ
ncbi:MAG TPA: T9SS type A sorting domain-containing protein [Bacteroidia bacterium]|nr:T9SS type A sorting domain-containing protein [Bacteroidia bacterium]